MIERQRIFGKRGESTTGDKEPELRNILAFNNIGDESVTELVGRLIEMRGEMRHGLGAMDPSPQDRQLIRSLSERLSSRLVELGREPLKEGELE